MPPTISAPTANATISKIVGDTVTLTIAASGTGTLSYQWYKGSTTVGTNSATLPIKPIVFTDSGTYTCAVTSGCGTTTSKAMTLKVKAVAVVKVAAGSSHAMILKNDGTLWATGSNFNGELGDGSTTNHSSPFQLMSNVATISAGNGYTMIVKTDSTLWGTGYNASGQLGDGTTTNRLAPVLIMSGVKIVSAGNFHTMILKNDGTLWATGDNSYGQFGDGTTSAHLSPIEIKINGISGGVSSVSVGGGHTMILKSDGTLWATGYNYYGQLGDSTTVDRHLPYQVASGVLSVCAGDAYTMIIKTDGSLFATGYNAYGQLGDGSIINRHIPVSITTGVALASASLYNTMVVKTDGTLWAMGFNNNGELGDGSKTEQNLPEQIKTNGIGGGALTVSTGGSFSMIVTTSGQLWATGSNSFGQLGDGTITNILIPKLIIP
jgi:alpha-tubulin suppressor-like RCC1 family protein